MGQQNEVSPEGAEPENKDAEKNTLPVDQLENGPVQDRGCTDVICCLVFVAFLVFLVAAGGYGLIHGKPELLLTPWDYDGLGCGYSAATVNYPYLYFPSVDVGAVQSAASNPSSASVSDILKYGVCVKTCPLRTGDVDCKQASFMKSTKGQENYKACEWYPAGVVSDTPARYETAPLGRFCAPAGKALEDQAVKLFKTQFNQYFGRFNIQSYVADVVSAREILAWTLLSGFFIGFVYMIFMRLFGGPLVYFSILGLILGTAYGGWMVYQSWQDMVASDPTHPHIQYYQYGAYTIWGIAALLFCCTLCNWNNIKIGVAVMKCTAQYIGNNPQVFLVPPLACVVILAWLAVWVYFAAHIVSIGTLKPNGVLTTVVWSDETRYVFLYSLFGYLWLNAFIIGVTQFIISASAALWYFTSSGDSNGKGSLCKGLYWVFRYHLGSIAFGAFLIALVQFIRIIFEYYKRQLEKAGKENKVVKILLCLTSYLLDCLERFIKFISKNAYIQIALTGKNFCASAWNAFILIMKNVMRFGTAQSIGFIFNVLGVCFIAAANGMVVYSLLHYVPQYKGLVQSWIGPSVVGVMEGFIIGTMFMSVFSFASDTILQAFLVDQELGRPEGMRPVIMNQFIEGIESNRGKD